MSSPVVAQVGLPVNTNISTDPFLVYREASSVFGVQEKLNSIPKTPVLNPTLSVLGPESESLATSTSSTVIHLPDNSNNTSKLFSAASSNPWLGTSFETVVGKTYHLPYRFRTPEIIQIITRINTEAPKISELALSEKDLNTYVYSCSSSGQLAVKLQEKLDSILSLLEYSKIPQGPQELSPLVLENSLPTPQLQILPSNLTLPDILNTQACIDSINRYNEAIKFEGNNSPLSQDDISIIVNRLPALSEKEFIKQLDELIDYLTTDNSSTPKVSPSLILNSENAPTSSNTS